MKANKTKFRKPTSKKCGKITTMDSSGYKGAAVECARNAADRDVTDTSDALDSKSLTFTSKAHRYDLISAVSDGDLRRVRACLQDPHCNVNVVDHEGDTVLMLAAERAKRGADSAQIMRELLAQDRIKVNQRDVEGLTALHYGVLYKKPCSCRIAGKLQTL